MLCKFRKIDTKFGGMRAKDFRERPKSRLVVREITIRSKGAQSRETISADRWYPSPGYSKWKRWRSVDDVRRIRVIEKTSHDTRNVTERVRCSELQHRSRRCDPRHASDVCASRRACLGRGNKRRYGCPVE